MVTQFVSGRSARTALSAWCQRSWTAGFDDPQFWNPKLRAPVCLNAAAAARSSGRSRTNEVASRGGLKTEMLARTRAAVAAAVKFTLPAPGAMSYSAMSKQEYLGDTAGHWHPHLMFFVSRTDSAAWGANLDGSPVIDAQDDHDPTTTFFVLVPTWSDRNARRHGASLSAL